MINIMDAELAYVMISVVITILATAIATILAIKSSAKDTRRILERIGCAIDKIASHSSVDLGLRGVEIAEDIESEEVAKKLGEVVKYNPKLKVAYYKPRKSSV